MAENEHVNIKASPSKIKSISRIGYSSLIKKNHNSNENSGNNDKIEIDSHSIGNRRFIQCIRNVNVNDSEY